MLVETKGGSQRSAAEEEAQGADALTSEEMERFREHHPGIDEAVAENNALMMANRRFLARALGAVLPKWLAAGGT